jgi:hypothetical protein
MTSLEGFHPLSIIVGDFFHLLNKTLPKSVFLMLIPNGIGAILVKRHQKKFLFESYRLGP